MTTPRIHVAVRPHAPVQFLRITALAACVLATGIVVDARAQTAAPKGQPPGMQTASSQPQQAVFSKEELAQIVAPVALYPDALLAQVLMASTYPGDIADAAEVVEGAPRPERRCGGESRRQPALGPERAGTGGIPGRVGMLGTDINWTQKLGDAFLAQPDAVMEIRAGAARAGEDGRQPVVQRIPEGVGSSPADDRHRVLATRMSSTCLPTTRRPSMAAGCIRPIRRTTTRPRRTRIPAPRSSAASCGAWGSPSPAGSGATELGRRRHQHQLQPLQQLHAQQQHRPRRPRGGDRGQRRQVATRRRAPRWRALSRPGQPRQVRQPPAGRRQPRQLPRR